MSSLVLSIVGNVNKQNSVVKNGRADGWTAELAITASNVCKCRPTAAQNGAINDPVNGYLSPNPL